MSYQARYLLCGDEKVGGLSLLHESVAVLQRLTDQKA